MPTWSASYALAHGMPFRMAGAEIMKTKLAVMFLAGSSLFAATHISIGVGLGGYGGGYYAPPPPPVAYAPPCPGPGYSWVNGYWDSVASRRSWRPGYWARPQYGNAYRAEHRYDRNRYEENRHEENRYEGNRHGYGYDRR